MISDDVQRQMRLAILLKEEWFLSPIDAVMRFTSSGNGFCLKEAFDFFYEHTDAVKEDHDVERYKRYSIKAPGLYAADFRMGEIEDGSLRAVLTYNISKFDLRGGGQGMSRFQQELLHFNGARIEALLNQLGALAALDTEEDFWSRWTDEQRSVFAKLDLDIKQDTVQPDITKLTLRAIRDYYLCDYEEEMGVAYTIDVVFKGTKDESPGHEGEGFSDWVVDIAITFKPSAREDTLTSLGPEELKTALRNGETPEESEGHARYFKSGNLNQPQIIYVTNKLSACSDMFNLEHMKPDFTFIETLFATMRDPKAKFLEIIVLSKLLAEKDVTVDINGGRPFVLCKTPDESYYSVMNLRTPSTYTVAHSWLM